MTNDYEPQDPPPIYQVLTKPWEVGLWLTKYSILDNLCPDRSDSLRLQPLQMSYKGYKGKDKIGP